MLVSTLYHINSGTTGRFAAEEAGWEIGWVTKRLRPLIPTSVL